MIEEEEDRIKLCARMTPGKLPTFALKSSRKGSASAMGLSERDLVFFSYRHDKG